MSYSNLCVRYSAGDGDCAFVPSLEHHGRASQLRNHTNRIIIKSWYSGISLIRSPMGLGKEATLLLKLSKCTDGDINGEVPPFLFMKQKIMEER